MGDAEQAEATESEDEQHSRIMFEFHGPGGLLKGWQVQNVCSDQLLYLAKWLDWYSVRVKDYVEMRKAQTDSQILRPGENEPVPVDLRMFT